VNVWSILGTQATGDEREIKRAYARKLKVTRPEDDPQAFQELRDAYETALRMAKHAASLDVDQDDVDKARSEFAYEEASVYTAAYESEVTGPQDEVVYQAFYEFDPASAPAPISPMAQARRIWAEFLPGAHFEPRQRLRSVAASEDLLNLQVRECFELCAVQYCAAEGCAEEFRVAIAEHYHWEQDLSFIGREMPEETAATLARLRAHRSYTHFCELSRDDDVVRALLSDTVVKTFMPTTSKSFTRRMRDLIAQVHWHHADMLQLKLDHDVFNAWSNRVEGKRYFAETAMHSFLGGIALTSAILAGLAELRMNVALVFLAAEAVSFALFALFAFYWPRVSQLPLVATRLETLNILLHDHRYRPSWQFGWLGVYAFASLCMFIPNPSELSRWAVAAMMLFSACAASFANSVVLTWTGFAILAVVALALGMGVAQQAMTVYGAFTCVMAAFCLVQIHHRGGSDLLGWLSMHEAWFIPARLAWLAGAAGIFAYSHTARHAQALFPAMVWIWLLAGMFLSRPTINPIFAFMGAGFVSAVADRASGGSKLYSIDMPVLDVFLLAVSFFMAVNMFRAKTNQHQFT
jgi:hypothetical protein